jgi:hypothetical protein
MTNEEVRFFNLTRAYAERRHPFILRELTTLDERSMTRKLIFNDPKGPKDVTRQVTVSEDQFRESVGADVPSPAVARNIDEALSES